MTATLNIIHCIESPKGLSKTTFSEYETSDHSIRGLCERGPPGIPSFPEESYSRQNCGKPAIPGVLTTDLAGR